MINNQKWFKLKYTTIICIRYSIVQGGNLLGSEHLVDSHRNFWMVKVIELFNF